MGYIGSCVPFVVSLALIFGADYIGISGTVATAGAFIINALWWAVVTIPLLKIISRTIIWRQRQTV